MLSLYNITLSNYSEQRRIAPTSRRALQAWGCVPGSGSTLRRAGLKPEHSPWEDYITATPGFPTTADHDLPLCTALHTLAHIPIRVSTRRGAPLFTTDHIFFIYGLFADLALCSLAAI